MQTKSTSLVGFMYFYMVMAELKKTAILFLFVTPSVEKKSGGLCRVDFSFNLLAKHVQVDSIFGSLA